MGAIPAKRPVDGVVFHAQRNGAGPTPLCCRAANLNPCKPA